MKPKPGPKGPRGKRSIAAIARRAQRPAGIRHTALAQVAKAQTELDERKAKVVTLEAMVVRQSKTFRAEAAKFHEVRAQVITARPLSALSRTHPPSTSPHAISFLWSRCLQTFNTSPT